jgi:hypothetical protein
VQPPLVCRPLRFAESLSRRLYLLSRYCAPLGQLVVVFPGGLPPPLSRRPRLSSLLSIRWLSCRVTFSGFLVFPPPLITPPPLVAPLLFGWLSHRVAWRPGLFPPYCRARNAAVVVIDIVAIGSSGGIIAIAVAVAIAVSAIAVIAVIVDFEGREGGGYLVLPRVPRPLVWSWGIGGFLLARYLAIGGFRRRAGNNDFEVIICTCVDSC